MAEEDLLTVTLCLRRLADNPDNKTELREVKLSNGERSVLDIKLLVEKRFSIPVCVQTVRHSSTVLLRDTARLSSLRLRSGDTLHVVYYAPAHVELQLTVIAWLKELVVTLKLEGLPSREKPGTAQLDDTVSKRMLEYFGTIAFIPWGSPVKQTNKIFFVKNGGLDLMIQLYKILLSQPWSERTLDFKMLEYKLVSTIWNLCESFQVRRYILSQGGLDMCLQSLLCVEVDDEFLIDDKCPTSGYLTRHHSNIAQDNITCALGLLSILCELPECHMDIVVNVAAVVQISKLIVSPSMGTVGAINAVIVGLTLAYTTETHPYLIQADMVQQLLKSDTVRRTNFYFNDKCQMRYHVATLLSQLIVASPQHLPEDHLTSIHQYLQQLLSSVDIKSLTSYETAKEYVWATFLPYIKLIYQPNTPCHEPPLLSETQDMALQTTIIALHSMLDRSIHREVLVREGLVDYLICMPWYTTGSAQQKSRALVRMVQQSPDVDLQPPSLLNMTKACVAKNYCGLQTVVHLSVPDIIQQICF